jgi:hypothetical protein
MSSFSDKQFDSPSGFLDNLNIKNIILNDKHISGVGDSLEDTLSTDIASVGAVKAYANKIDMLISTLSAQLNDFNFIPVISEPLISIVPNTKEWKTKDIYINNHLATYESPNQSNVGYLKLSNNNIYTYTGRYVLVLDIPRLDSGHVDIKIDDIVIKTIESVGKHTVTYDIDNIYNSSLSVSITDTIATDIVQISQVYMCHVKESLTNYLEYMINYIITGNDDSVSNDELNNAISQLDNTLKQYTNQVVSQVAQVVNDHKNDKDNPHDITCSIIDAATRDHIHPIYQSHLDDENNPHGMTKDQLDLGNIPNNISDDPTIDSSTTLATTKLTHILYNTLSTLSTLINTVKTEFTLHRTATGNVHNLSKSDIDLGNVENYSPATTEDAELGYADNLYMTPLKTKKLLYKELDVNFNKPIQLYSTPISKLIVDNSYENQYISIVPGKKYSIHLKCMDTASLYNLGFRLRVAIPTSTTVDLFVDRSYPQIVNDPHRGDSELAYLDLTDISFITDYVSIIDYTTNDTIYAISDTFEDDCIVLTPNPDYINGIGKLELDTDSLFISGDILVYKVGDNIPTKLNITGVPTRDMMTSLLDAQYTLCDLVVVSRDHSPVSYELDIYEMVDAGVYQDLNSVDANPIGAIIESVSDIVPYGYVRLEGQSLDANAYTSLLNYARTNNLIISLDEYQQTLDTNVLCYKFGYTDGSWYFRVPNIPTTPRKIMKAFDYSI